MDFPAWLLFALIFLGGMALTFILGTLFPDVFQRRGSPAPHPGETEAGKERHAERMKGLRALADEVESQQDATPTTEDPNPSHKPTVQQADQGVDW